jgi:hypothetical protein
MESNCSWKESAGDPQDWIIIKAAIAGIRSRFILFKIIGLNFKNTLFLIFVQE